MYLSTRRTSAFTTVFVSVLPPVNELVVFSVILMLSVHCLLLLFQWPFRFCMWFLFRYVVRLKCLYLAEDKRAIFFICVLVVVCVFIRYLSY